MQEKPVPTKSDSIYVVSWRLNGVVYATSFKSQMLAHIKMIQLEQYGLEPTIHIKD